MSMKIRVSGSNMEVGQSLIQYVEENAEKAVKKFFENAIDVEVHFAKHNLLFVANIVINEGVRGRKLVIRSNAEAGDVYASFTEALNKSVIQLRKHKERIKHYRRSDAGLKGVEPDYSLIAATKYAIPPFEHNVFEEMEESEVTKSVQTSSVVSQKVTEVEELSVNEAIMKMELADLPALVFMNSEKKRLNVVYQRKDGNISLIDPQL